MPTFAEAVRATAIRFAPSPEIEAVLTSLGQRATQPLAELDAEQVVCLVSLVACGVRSVSVSEAMRLERALLTAIGGVAPGVRIIPLKDAISIIAVRNAVHRFAAAAGLEWADSMQVQAALSEAARHIVGSGGGRLELSLVGGALRVDLRIATDDPPAITPDRAPPWLAGAIKLARDVRVEPEPGGARVCFQVRRVAAAA